MHYNDLPEGTAHNQATMDDWKKLVRDNPNIKEFKLESPKYVYIFPVIDILVQGLKYLETFEVIMKWYEWNDKMHLPDIKCLTGILEQGEKLTKLKIVGMRGRKRDYHNFYKKFDKRLQHMTLELVFAEDEPQKTKLK